MGGTRPDPARPRRHLGAPVGQDAWGAVLMVAVVATLDLLADRDALSRDLLVSLAGGVLVAGVLAWRRAAPRLVLVVALVIFGVTAVIVGDVPLAFLPLLVALYTAVSQERSLVVAPVLGLAASAVAVLLAAIGAGYGWDDEQTLLLVVLCAITVAVGVAVGASRGAVRAARARATQAEETRDALARERVAEERLRIARDLHDVVGHQVAVVTVQAGVAAHLLASRPEKAAQAIELVQQAGARVLEELPTMLRLLRQDGDDDSGPRPGIAGLEDLATSARATGLVVSLALPDDVPDLASTVDLAAYRVVQEALTNARKHGDGSADVTVAVVDGLLAVEVVSPLRAAGSGTGPEGGAGAGSGFGLVGMRERVRSAGGELFAGPEGRRFVVRATLPLRSGPGAGSGPGTVSSDSTREGTP